MNFPFHTLALYLIAASLIGAIIYLLCGIRWSLLVFVALFALFFVGRWVANYAL